MKKYGIIDLCLETEVNKLKESRSLLWIKQQKDSFQQKEVNKKKKGGVSRPNSQSYFIALKHMMI